MRRAVCGSNEAERDRSAEPSGRRMKSYRPEQTGQKDIMTRAKNKEKEKGYIRLTWLRLLLVSIQQLSSRKNTPSKRNRTVARVKRDTRGFHPRSAIEVRFSEPSVHPGPSLINIAVPFFQANGTFDGNVSDHRLPFLRSPCVTGYDADRFLNYTQARERIEAVARGCTPSGSKGTPSRDGKNAPEVAVATWGLFAAAWSCPSITNSRATRPNSS
jgi:hypothetical protein